MSIYTTQTHKMSRINLTPYQSLQLYGWFSRNVKTMLSWDDVVRNNITFEKCRQCNISIKDLHKIQPNLLEWKQNASLSITHLPEMAKTFKSHPIHDFQADFGDLVSTGWNADTMHMLGVTYNNLVGIGMTIDTMQLFRFTLLSWIRLGFGQQDVNGMSDYQTITLFGLSKMDTERCFSNHPV
jgi:hypothetical protein